MTPRGGVALTIGSHQWTKERPKVDTLDLVLLPKMDRVRVEAQMESAVSGAMLMVRELPDDFPNRIAASNGLRLEVDGQSIGEFRYGSAAAAVRHLATCNDELLKSWGIDPASFSHLQQKPVPTLAPWRVFVPGDYPSASLRNNEGGTVVARYTIGADGSVAQCEIAKSSGHKRLDDKTCTVLMSRVRYQPAIGKEGTPVPIVTAIPITWAIPGR